MKYVLIFSGLFLLLPFTSSAVSMEKLIKKDLKAPVPAFPKVTSGNFTSLQEAAVKGDQTAQKQLVDFQLGYIQSVYKPLKPLGDLLASARKPQKGYDTASANYAANLEKFFEETSGAVRVRKKYFDVQTKDGTLYSVSFPEYRSSDNSVQVKNDNGTQWISLTDLSDSDSCFIRNALADEQFDSSSEFEISTSDVRMDDISKADQRGHVDHIHRDTGERVVGSYVSSSMDGVLRTVVLENRGSLPLENLVVEYQSFVEQTLLGLPENIPPDYCCVGCVEVPSLAAGERKEIQIDLPVTVNAKTESINTGDYEYSVAVPAGLNKQSEGRMNGIWVKVHRFTPYGEHLVREYKSSGVPSREWTCVVPVSTVQ